MSVGNYYALTALPTLDPPGTPPPVSLVELPGRIPAGRARRLASAVLLQDDLLQREAWLAGELKSPEPAVLTLAELRGSSSLPGPLAGPPAGSLADVDDDGGRLLPVDVLWSAYVRYVTLLSASLRCALLRDWIASEIGVRNGLAERRARALGLAPDDYRVSEALGHAGPEEEEAVRAWAEAPHPLGGLRALLRVRWRWMAAREPHFTFRDDEFVAYAVKLVILHRWRRAGGGKGDAAQ